MSESRIRRLTPVLDIALDEERKAAGMLGDCQRQLDDSQARLRDLEIYCKEYQNGWTQRFMAQMQTAIEQQNQTVIWHGKSLEKAREVWRQRYQRLEAMRKLIERYQQEARVRADKQAQKLLDELSPRAFDRNRNTP